MLTIRGVPSLEFMALQNDSFFKDLTKCIEFIRRDPDVKSVTIHESGISEFINARLQSNVTFFVDKSPFPNAYVRLPELDKNHPFFKNWAQWVTPDMGKLVANSQKISDRIGYVNVEHAKLDGVFSRIPISMCVTYGLLRDSRLSDAEIAAILLHEIGHMFTYFYYMLHSTIGGFISTAVATAAAGAKSDKERVVIFETGAKVLGIDDVAIYSMLQNTADQNSVILQTLYINENINNLRSETGYGMYEMKACEQLADAFAAKFGASAELATALPKIVGGLEASSNKALLYLMNGINVAIMVALMFTPITAAFVIFSVLLGGDKYEGIYDNLKDRVKYLKQHLINGLKSAKMPEADVKRYISEIEKVEQIIANTQYAPSVVALIRNVLIPNARRRNRAVELQKNIEELMYSDLWVTASKLKGATQ